MGTGRDCGLFLTRAHGLASPRPNRPRVPIPVFVCPLCCCNPHKRFGHEAVTNAFSTPRWIAAYTPGYSTPTRGPGTAPVRLVGAVALEVAARAPAGSPRSPQKQIPITKRINGLH